MHSTLHPRARARHPASPEERDVHDPPTAEHLAAVVGAVKPLYRLPLLVLDDTGMRVSELVSLRWGDVDEAGGRWRIAPLHEKTRRWVAVSPALFEAVLELKTLRTVRPPPPSSASPMRSYGWRLPEPAAPRVRRSSVPTTSDEDA